MRQNRRDGKGINVLARRQPISTTLAPEIIQWIDVTRGDASRSKFLERILEREMEREKKGGSQ